MSSPEILRATLGNMGKEKFSLSQAKQNKSKTLKLLKNKEQIKKEKNTAQDTDF